ncbi:hypothetical protein [Parapedobacter tibetensis]|uniref:hypothetical protein n=1 Tax=Parapedobacter tibetensis TaxID=2972951 RepID=UPI00214D5BFB|nr:hypothetical protein [Parapedobacter tibetensis]
MVDKVGYLNIDFTITEEYLDRFKGVWGLTGKKLSVDVANILKTELLDYLFGLYEIFFKVTPIVMPFIKMIAL